MIVKLGEDASSALRRLGERLKEHGVRRAYSRVVNQLVIDFCSSASASQIEELMSHLLTPQDKCKALLKKASQLAEKPDEVALRALEKSMKQLRKSIELSSKNQA
jgi:hypothetical protein